MALCYLPTKPYLVWLHLRDTHLPHSFLCSTLKPWSDHSPCSCSSVPCLTPWKLATVIPINFFKLFYCTHAWCKSLMASATILSSLSCMSDTGIDSISKSRYMTVWVGHRTDFRRWMTNPNFRKHVQWCLNVPATFQFWIIRQESIVNEDIRGKPWAM